MSHREGQVRRRLSRAARPAAGQDDDSGLPERGHGPVVAVTGAAQGLGHALTARLAASDRIGRVVAIDDHRGDVTGVTWRLVDVRDPALAGRLTGVDVLVHTDVDLAPDTDARARRAFNVRGAQTVLTAAAAGRVGRAVSWSPARWCTAPAPDNPVPLAESAPPAADLDGSVVGDLLEIEHLARRSPADPPGPDVTVVRPAALVGDGVETRWSPGISRRRGCSPSRAPRRAGSSATSMIWCRRWSWPWPATSPATSRSAATAGWSSRGVEELSGLRRMELPAGLTFGTAQRLHRAGSPRRRWST